MKSSTKALTRRGGILIMVLVMVLSFPLSMSSVLGSEIVNKEAITESQILDTDNTAVTNEGTGEKVHPSGIQNRLGGEGDFDFDNGVIKEYLGSDVDLVIPSTINGEAVVEIDELAFWDTDIETVFIPESIKTIGNHAFYNCLALNKVTFEGEPPAFGYGVFLDSSYDTVFYCHVDYKDAYENLLDDFISFFGGGTLETFGVPTNPVIPEEKGDGLSFEIIGEGAIVTGYNGDGGDVVIPDTYEGKAVVAIADKAFDAVSVSFETKGRLDITSIKMPDTVTTIGNWAFANCKNMTSIQLSKNLTSIGEHAFQYCNQLVSIDVPASVTEIKDLAFTMCSSLQSIKVASSNPNYKDIDGVLFNKAGTTLIQYPSGNNLTTYTVPEGVELIGADSFKLYYAETNKSALRDVIYPTTLKEIGDRAFMQSNLERITLQSDIKMGDYVYELCKNVKTVTIGEGVTKITKGLFYGLENCTEVNLPSTLKTIEYRAFDRCGITSINLPEGLETIGEEAFENSQLTALTIPSTVTTIGDRAFYSIDTLKSLDFRANAKIESIGPYAFNHCTDLSVVNLPNSLKTLENGVFSHCYALESIDLPNSITTLKDCVFAGSSLTSIALPNSIVNMGSCNFRECPNLTSVKMPAYLETLGTCTFEMDRNLLTVEMADTMKLTSLPSDTFFECEGLRNIFLPTSIAATEACSFSNCDDALVIEYGNKDLKRSLFDCYNVNPGEFYELREDGFYYTTDFTDEDNSGGAYDEIEKLNTASEEGVLGETNSEINGTRALGQDATCGCATGGSGFLLRPTCNPLFKHIDTTSEVTPPVVTPPGIKPPAPSQNLGNNGNNGANSGGSSNTGNTSGSRSGGLFVEYGSGTYNAIPAGTTYSQGITTASSGSAIAADSKSAFKADTVAKVKKTPVATKSAALANATTPGTTSALPYIIFGIAAFVLVGLVFFMLNREHKRK